MSRRSSFSAIITTTLNLFTLMQASTYSALRFMCRDYLVKISDSSCPRGRLVGLTGLVDYVGEELAVRLFNRAERCRLDKCVCRLRRGAVVSFYNK